MRPALPTDLTVGEAVNANYEALKIELASTVAALLASNDPIAMNKIVHRIVEEVDDTRYDFIMEMRKGDTEAELVD